MPDTVQMDDPLFMLGRAMTVAETTVIVRRATCDPGEFTPRRVFRGEEEGLTRWQARAIVIALGEDGPSFEAKWSNFDQAAENLRREDRHYAEMLAASEGVGA
jgi:hypothetical protein